MKPDVTPATTVARGVTANGDDHSDSPTASNTAAARPSATIRALSAETTAAPMIAPGIRPATASATPRPSTWRVLVAATHNDSGSTATRMPPGTKSVSTIARMGAASSPNPSPIDPWTSAPTTARPMQSNAAAGDISVRATRCACR